MAKKKKSDFEFIRAIRDADGNCRFEWQLVKKGAPVGGVAHDEDVSGWDDSQIKSLAKSVAGADDDDPVHVEVQNE